MKASRNTSPHSAQNKECTAISGLCSGAPGRLLSPGRGDFPVQEVQDAYPVIEPAQRLQGADVLTGHIELEGPAQDVLSLTTVKGSRDLTLHGLEQRIQ